MAITPIFKNIPKDVVEWARFFSAVRRSDGDIEDAELRDSAPNSVIGRAEGTQGTPGDIVASADDQFLRSRGGTLGFGAIIDADIPSTIARDTEVTAAITAHEAALDPHPTYTTAAELAAGIAAHVALADPHPVYMTSTEVDTSIAAHAALADPHPVYPLAAGTETISGSWTFTSNVVLDGGVGYRCTVSGTLQGIFGVSSGASGIINGSVSGDVCVRSQGGSLLFSGNSGTNIHFSVTSSLVHARTAFRMDVTTGTTAPSAGGAGALPATPAGYATVNIGGTNRQIPYY